MRRPDWEIELSPSLRTILGVRLGADVRVAEPQGNDPWRRTVEECHRHRLMGLLVAAVADDILATTDDQRAEVARLEVELTRTQVWHDAKLVEVSTTLAEAGIAHLVLKGPAFGSLDYCDRLMRPTGDIDLLIRGSDLRAAVDLLRGPDGVLVDPDPVPGYSETVGKSQTIVRPDTLEIDLHRLLARGPFGIRVVADDLWVAPRGFTIAGAPLQTLGTEDSLLHACLHLMILSERRALSLRDVAELLGSPALDAARAVDLARTWRIEIVLAAAVLQVEHHLGLQRSEAGAALDRWARAHHPGQLDRLYLRIAEPEDPIGPAEWPATFVALPSARARRVLLRSILAPAPGTNARFLDRVRSLMVRSVRSVRSIRRHRPH